MLNKGDKVVIEDGSWTQSVVNEKLVCELLNYGHEEGKDYTVIETGCSFPLTRGRFSSTQPEKYRNDTVIQAVDSGKVVFIHGRFLRQVLPTHTVMIDMRPTSCSAVLETGQTVEVSDELYQEIKRSL